MNKRILIMGCISGFSLGMLTSCSDSNSDIYNPANPIAGIDGDSSSSIADEDYSDITSSDSETGSSTGTPESSATTDSSNSNGTKPSGKSSSSNVTPGVNSSSSATPTAQSSSSEQSKQINENTGVCDTHRRWPIRVLLAW